VKTLIATCSASYANVPIVSPVCPSNDNYVPTPMISIESTTKQSCHIQLHALILVK